MRTFQSKIISTLLGTFLLGTSSLMWAEEAVDPILGVVPQACMDVRATYKADKIAIEQSCLDERDARNQALADCDGFWNYCKTPCDQTPPVTGKIKAGGQSAWVNLCAAKQTLEECKIQKTADLETFQQEVNEICCPFWPCRNIGCPSIVGDWTLNYDWGCYGGFRSTSLIFNADHTGTLPLEGYSISWSQNRCDMQFVFPSGTTYTGNVNAGGTYLSGTMVSGSGLTGCWTADRVENGAEVPNEINDEPLDSDGNPK